jgi:hypothetical protein
MKDNIKTEYYKGVRKILKCKLSGGNVVNAQRKRSGSCSQCIGHCINK